MICGRGGGKARIPLRGICAWVRVGEQKGGEWRGSISWWEDKRMRTGTGKLDGMLRKPLVRL
jgi:hypothetical protein